MNNNWKIIQELFESRWLLKQCFFVTKNIEQAEFYQSEIIMKLYSLEKLGELYDKNQHKYYITKLIFNLITDTRKKDVYRFQLENTISFEDYFFKKNEEN